MSGVVTPLIDYIENFCADNAAQHRENAEIPSFVAVIAQPLGVAHADPKSEQDAQRDQKSVRWQKKTPDMKKLWEHLVYWMRRTGDLLPNQSNKKAARIKRRKLVPPV